MNNSPRWRAEPGKPGYAADGDGKAKRRKAPAQAPTASGTNTEYAPTTDTGNAERFTADHRTDVRYVYRWQKWIAWDGVRWAIDAAGAVEALAKQTVRNLYRAASEQPDDAIRRALVTWARRSESASARAALLRLAQSEDGIPVLPEALGTDRWLLNVENGTVDLRTGALRPHDRADLITKLAPVAFEPEATAPS